MSLGDNGNNKDIRQRAQEFLQHGVLGCCPETKALGKTIADANVPKQPETALPNVVTKGSYRFDPKGKWQPGSILKLFPTSTERNSVHGKPNFGWEQDVPELTPEQVAEGLAAKLKKFIDGPQIVQEVWEVDDQGNPTKLVRTNGDEEKKDNEVEGKGLGRTLRQMNPGNTLIARAAKRFGLWVDGLGKFRCPPGTPQANQFTDEFGTTCFAVSASQIINAAQEGFASLGSWWRRWQQSRLPFFIDEFGNVTENIDIASGRQEYRRIFTGARSRVRARVLEMEGNIADLLRIAGISPSSTDNNDLRQLLKKLNPELRIATVDIDAVWNNLSPAQRAALERRGINKQALVDTERGFLMAIAELAITDPDRLAKIRKIEPLNPEDGRHDEAVTSIFDTTAAVKDVEYTIRYDPVEMAKTTVSQIEEVKENQRLGLRVVGAASDEEAADAMHQFVVNEQQWAGGMSASLGKNPFLTKGIHTSLHEISHTIQIDKFAEKIIETKGSSARFSDLDNGSIYDTMRGIGDEIDLEDLGLATSDLDRVAFLGGAYGRDQYEEDGAVSESWRLEATAELYALRQLGVIEGDDVDGALAFMDSVKPQKSRAMREASKKKNLKRIEKEMAKRRPDDVPGARRPDDAPGATTSRRRSGRAKNVRTPRDADATGRSIRERTMDKLDKEEIETIDRIGDPRNSNAISLVNPSEMTDAIISIDSGHKFARKHGADLDEIDVSKSRGLERVAYDPKRQRLYVTYRARDGGPGRSYFYRDVKPETVLELHKAEIKGRAINDIKKAHLVVGVEKIPEKVDRKSITDGDIASQVQFNLIPTLTALDKSEIGENIRVVITADPTKGGGEIQEFKGVTTGRIYHDGTDIKPDEVVLFLPANARGIPFRAGAFDREESGSTTLIMLPPMRAGLLDDKDGRRAHVVDQEFSHITLSRMLDQWPSGSDAREGRILNSAKNRAEEVVATHLALGEGSGRLPDGETTPILASRIRTRNADVHDRQTRRRSTPTKPTKKYRDTVPKTRTFASMGEIETSEERSFRRTSGLASMVPSLRTDALTDPEIQRMIKDADDRDVVRLVEAAAVDFHEGIDRRPRLRVSSDELGKVLKDGGRKFEDRGFSSVADRKYQELYGIHPDVSDIDRPVSGYVVHPSQDRAARDAMRRRGVQVGDAPVEWPQGSNPHGDVDADGEIEVVLKPEVSGRTAYGFGYGLDYRTRPVWMNSSEHSQIADAIVHADPSADPDGSRMRMMNALSSLVDGDFGYFTDIGSVKPAATNQNERTDDFTRRVGEHVKASKPQRLGAHIMGGFVNEEISEIRYPWSRITKESSDVDISDVVNKEPVSDRLRRLGFTDAEIEYFYKVNGDRSLDYISSATMASLREYRKALKVKEDYEARGIPMVSFAHPAGLDPLDLTSYAQNPTPKMTVETALAKAINEEVDALVEKMLKQVRKTRGKLWEMRPKAGAVT
jgi:hypothetical protein